MSVNVLVAAEVLYLCPAIRLANLHWVLPFFIHGMTCVVLSHCLLDLLAVMSPGSHCQRKFLGLMLFVCDCVSSLFLTCWGCNTDCFYPFWQSHLLAVKSVCCEAEATGTLQIRSAGFTLLSYWWTECVTAELRSVYRRSCGGIPLYRGLLCGDTNRKILFRKQKENF